MKPTAPVPRRPRRGLVPLDRIARDERGNFAVMAALLIGLLAVTGGAAVSFTRAAAAGKELQALADAGALAAVRALAEPDATDSSVHGVVQALPRVIRMGDRRTPATLTVAIESRAPNRLTVTARDHVPVHFGEMIGLSRLAVARSATAVGEPPRTLCLLLLEAAAAGALSIGGSSAVRAPDCVAQINSAAAGAISISGGASAAMKTTHVTGPASMLRSFTPAPLWSQPAVSDPFAAQITWPSAGAPCTYQSLSISGVGSRLSPGVYCGGLTLGSNAGVTLEPGVHVISTGHLSVGSNAVVDAPAGVTIVLLDPLGTFDVRGTARIQAPREGPWRGMAIAVKPQAAERISAMGAGGEMQIRGALYLPTQKLEITGNSAAVGRGTSSLIVARKLALTGTADLELEGDARMFSVLEVPLKLTH
jgi:hypothetical protein